jgi:SAM-dependent methyltransferase
MRDFLEWEIDDLRPRAKRILDYGCGKGTDADHFDYEKYDLYYFPEKPEGKFDAIVCNYVLCVVEEKDQQAIIDDVMSMLNPGGWAYFTVRRDKKNLNGWTSRGTFQRYVELDMDVACEEKGRYIIYKVQQREGMITTDVKFTLRIKPEECKTEFKEGMGVGVLYTEVASFHQTPEEYNSEHGQYELAMGVNSHANGLMDRFMEVTYEEYKEDD